MDTGYVNLLDEAIRLRVLDETRVVLGGQFRRRRRYCPIAPAIRFPWRLTRGK